MKRKLIFDRAGHFAAFWLTIVLAAAAIVSADIKLPASSFRTDDRPGVTINEK